MDDEANHVVRPLPLALSIRKKKKRKTTDDGAGCKWIPEHAERCEELHQECTRMLSERRGAPVPQGSRAASVGVRGSLIIEHDDDLMSAGLTEAGELGVHMRSRAAPATFEPQRYIHMVGGRPVVVPR